MTTVTHLASRRTAPTTPLALLEIIQIHYAQAHNALSTALHYLAQPECTRCTCC